jgi:hypothetical protein
MNATVTILFLALVFPITSVRLEQQFYLCYSYVFRIIKEVLVSKNIAFFKFASASGCILIPSLLLISKCWLQVTTVNHVSAQGTSTQMIQDLAIL